MNKIFSIIGSAALIGSLTSCNLDNPENVNTYTFDVLNHISSEDTDFIPMINKGSYTIRIDANTKNLRIETSSLLINNVSGNFETSDIRYSAQGFMTQFQTGSIISFDSGNSNVAKSGGQKLTNLKGYLNSTNYPAAQLQTTPVFCYNYGPYHVTTLRADSYFTGQSTITSGENDPTISDQGVYRIMINPQTMTAQIAIGFLPLPGLSENRYYTLKDLEVIPAQNSYEIIGADIIAEVSDDPGDHSRKFSKIAFKTTNKYLTKGQITMSMDEEEPITVNGEITYTLFNDAE